MKMSNQAQVRTKSNPTGTFQVNGILQRKCDCGQHTIAGGECDGCSKKHPPLQRATRDSETETQNSGGVPEIVHEVLRSSGQSLEATTRAFFEPRFGHDFSQVRVHTDERAAESAQAVNALAYTVGRDVVFGAGRYEPMTSKGKSLLAHELTHVVQQSGAGGSLQAQGVQGNDLDELERVAEETSKSVSDTSPADTSAVPGSLVANRAHAGMMRAPDPEATKKCLAECEERFDECLKHTRFPPECLARRGVCQSSCEPSTKPAEKPDEKAEEKPKAVKIEDLTLESRGRKEKVDPAKVTSGIWWLNGVTPTLYPLYPTEQNINTGLPALGDFQYEVAKGADKLALLSGAAESSTLTTKDAPTVRVRGIGPSKAAKDVTIKITHTPPKSKVSSVYSASLEVRAPNVLDGLSCSHKPNGAEGFTSIFQARVKDNLGAPMPYIDFNEDFDAGTLAPGVTGLWRGAMAARTKGHSITLGDAVIEDHYESAITGGKAPPDMAPRPSNPRTPLGNELVGSFAHRWYVGTQAIGKGVQVSAHVGKLFSDHGAYTDFVSPLAPKGKPDECPKTKAP